MCHSSQVQLTRDSRTLFVAEPDAVTLVALRGGERRRIAPPESRPPMIADALELRPCRPRLSLAAELVKLDREIQSITLSALRASLSPGR